MAGLPFCKKYCASDEIILYNCVLHFSIVEFVNKSIHLRKRFERLINFKGTLLKIKKNTNE